MHARLAIFPVRSVDRSEAYEFAADASKVFEELSGYRDATFLANGDFTEVAALSIWESEEDAVSHSDQLRQMVASSMGEYLTGEPTIKIYEVMEK
jgi:heme-degrading monooxygenase HmoA